LRTLKPPQFIGLAETAELPQTPTRI